MRDYDLNGNFFRCSDRDAYAGGVKIRGELNICNICFRNPLHPDGLPDTALRRIVHAARIKGLFAAAPPGGVRQVGDAHAQFIDIACEIVGNVRFKRKITSVMAGDASAVEVDLTGFVDCSEVKDEALSLSFFDSEDTVIPKHFIR